MPTPEEEAAAAAKAAEEKASAEKAAADKAAADQAAADKAELEKLRADNQALSQKARIYDAVSPFIKVDAEGNVEITPPPGGRGAPNPDDNPAPSKEEIEASLRKGTKETADLVQADADNVRGLEEKYAGDPLLKENMAIVRTMIKKVDIRLRNPQVYENCYNLAVGQHRTKYMEIARAEGARSKEEEITKSLKLNTRQSRQQKTVEQMVSDLTDTDRARARRAGMTDEAYAKRLAEMSDMKSKSLAGGE